jgi:hypothetical protein
MANGASIKARTKGGKDLRTNKTIREDNAVIKYKVTMNNQFDNALDLQNREKDLIQTLQQNKRSNNINKLNENR